MDNFNASPATAGGDVFAADDISGVKYPRSKVGFGSDGAYVDVDVANPLPVNVGTVPVTGTFWQATQPISGSVSVSNFPATQPVSGTFWQATQPVSIAASVAVTGPLTDTQLRATAVPVSAAQTGTWTVQPGNTANTTPWLAKISDGTNAAAIKAASTAAVAADPALVVAISPNNTVPVSLASVPSHAVTNAGTFAVQASGIAANGAAVDRKSVV